MFAFIVILPLSILAFILISRHKIKWFNIKVINILLFALSFAALFTTFSLFINSALYVSNYQYNGNIHMVTGGSFWTNMMWLELPILFFLTLILGIRVIRDKK
jgi:hypothetical protein